MLADLPAAAEAVLLQELHGRAEQEASRRLTTGGHLGDGLDQPPAGPGDLVERAFQPGAGDALPSVSPVDVEAGDAPVRTRRGPLVVLAPVLDARKLLRAAELAPALGDAVLVEDQGCVGMAGADPFLLHRPVVHALLAALEVVADAPAATEDAVVALDEVREGLPGVGVQGSGRQHRHLSCPVVAPGPSGRTG